MAKFTTSSLCSPISCSKPFSRTGIIKPNRNTRVCTKTLAMRRRSEDSNHNYNDRIVDENMIVLRKRIHEMEMMERNYEPPMEWMDWEKRVYPNYDSMICDAMMWLQWHLMGTRPSVALGVIALVALSVPTSTAVVLINFLELIKGFLHGIHLS